MDQKEKTNDPIVDDIDALIAEYKPPEIVWVYLADGRKMGFRPAQRDAESTAFRSEAAEWYAGLPKRGTPGDAAHPVFAGLIPETVSEAAKAYFVHKHAVCPPIGLDRALRMLEAPSLIDHIYDTVRLESKDVQRMAQANLVKAALGKSSGTTTNDAE